MHKEWFLLQRTNASAEATLSEILPQHNLVDTIQDVLHILGISCCRLFDVNVLLFVLHHALEFPAYEIQRGLGILPTC
eukprot:1684838-Prymnesium_polylepis.3